LSPGFTPPTGVRERRFGGYGFRGDMAGHGEEREEGVEDAVLTKGRELFLLNSSIHPYPS
jgi:hypothetical protein